MQPQPGQTITPNTPPEQPADTGLPQAPQPPVSETPTPPVPEVTQPPQDFYQPESDPPPQPSPVQNNDSPALASWTASEYIDHNKSPVWFMLLGGGLFICVGLVYYFSKDVLVAVLLALAGITFGVFAARPPKVLAYSIAPEGITIGDRLHHFGEIKSFALVEDGPIPSLLLMPMKRFMPPITIFYDPQEEDKIIEALANYLPHENKEPDMVDRLMSRIRF